MLMVREKLSFKRKENNMYKNSLLMLIAVVVILAAVFIPTLSFDRMLGNDANKIMNKINEVISLENDLTAVSQKCDELQALWKKHMNHWSFIVHHSAIEKIDLGICAFIEFAKEGESISRNIEAEKLEKILEFTSKQDKLNLLNIL